MGAGFKIEQITSDETIGSIFQYGFFVSRNLGVTRHLTFVMVDWCEDNFGPHGVQWSWTFLPMSNCWRFVFRSQADATAFKIRWA